MKKYVKPQVKCIRMNTQCCLLAGSGMSVANQNHQQRPHESWGAKAGDLPEGATPLFEDEE